jgi:hypothetical protein
MGASYCRRRTASSDRVSGLTRREPRNPRRLMLPTGFSALEVAGVEEIADSSAIKGLRSQPLLTAAIEPKGLSGRVATPLDEGANVCPHCGQRMLMRHGVRLPPRLADLFDMIERSKRRGVLCEVLAWVFYPDKAAFAARRCVAVNVHHLNSLLEQTDVRVVGGKDGQIAKPYRVVMFIGTDRHGRADQRTGAKGHDQAGSILISGSYSLTIENIPAAIAHSQIVVAQS